MYILEFGRTEEVLEFGRGKDKKPRKRRKRTELGESVRKNAKIGAAFGATVAGLNLYHNRKNIVNSRNFAREAFKKSGISPRAANVIANTTTSIDTGLIAGQKVAKEAAIGAGIGYGFTKLARASRNKFGNARADREADRRYRKRKGL